MRFKAAFSLIFLCLFATAYAVEQPPQPVVEKPEIRDLGDDKYQIGQILVDKDEKTFTVPGKILRLEPPIEFLAVSRGGHRGYESFLELDADPYQFNLACILIGMEENKGTPPKFHFDPTPLQGSAAEIFLEWKAGGDTRELRVTEIFRSAGSEEAVNEWIYTGSSFAQNGRYMADTAGGTLVGLVHDPASIIEHRSGYGKTSFNTLKPDPKIAPSLQTPIRLIVKRKD